MQLSKGGGLLNQRGLPSSKRGVDNQEKRRSCEKYGQQEHWAGFLFSESVMGVKRISSRSEKK